MATSDWKMAEGAACRSCPDGNVWYAVWESSDGAFEDTHYHCRNCGFDWWVDGPDA